MPPKTNGSKAALLNDNGDEANPIDVEELDTAPGPNGIAAYELPKSKVLKIAKASLPTNVKLQKEIAPALTRGSTVFVSYLATLAHEAATERGVKTITADDVLNSLEELDWDEGFTTAMRKDMKKQLKAFRAIAKAKKDGVPLPAQGASSKSNGEAVSSKAKGKQRAAEDDENEAMAGSEPEAAIGGESEPEGLLGAASDEEGGEEEEEEGNVMRLVDDRDGAGDESPIEDEDAEEDEEEEDGEEDDEAEEVEEPENPDDYDDEMGKGLDSKRSSKNGEDPMEADET